MENKFQQNHQKLVYLGLGSNLGNRLENFRQAISQLSNNVCIEITQISHVLETKAILVKGSPENWNIPFLNMVVSGKPLCSPQDLLKKIKQIEQNMGRDLNAPKWSPRVIDIDILDYCSQKISQEDLILPHKEIKNRDFVQYSMAELGYDAGDTLQDFQAINHFVLYPKFVGIVNVTPDSFSDGGKFFDPKDAINQIKKLVSDGAHMVDIGAQSTRPGYTEVSAQEEIRRLSKVLERCDDFPPETCNLSLDTYYDEVLEYAIKNHPNIIKCANMQQFRIHKNVINMVADYGMKIVIMLNGTDLQWFVDTINTLENWGMKRENIIVDPGIGFGKNKIQNVRMIQSLCDLRQFGCEIMLAHSRKSFISLFSNADAASRDIETLAFSQKAFENGAADYLRVHNVADHMRFFVAAFVAKNWAEEGVIA